MMINPTTTTICNNNMMMTTVMNANNGAVVGSSAVSNSCATATNSSLTLSAIAPYGDIITIVIFILFAFAMILFVAILIGGD